MSALYQKYRPQRFSEIFGQNHIKLSLQNGILRQQISHAYLFCGPRAVGKTTLARVFAKAINCQNRSEKDFEPCNACPICESINNFSNLDIIEIDAASNTGVDNVRENIISLSRIKSSNNKYKVFIIDEVHMLSLSAFNALLKTLEEPPKNVVFILCTTEVYKVPLTIISRCQRFDFKRIGVNDMVKKLEHIIKNEKLEVDREVLDLIALKSDGHLRDAESLLSQIIAISDRKIDLASANLIIPYNDLEENIKILEAISKKDLSTAIKIINEISRNNINLKNFLNDLIELLRKMILSKVNASLPSALGLDLGEKLEIKINNLNQAFSLSDLVMMSEEFLEASKKLNTALIVQLPIELALISIYSKLDSTTKTFIKETGEKDREQETITNTKKEEKQENLNKAEEDALSKKEIEDFKKNQINKEVSINKDEVLSLQDIKSGWTEFINKLKPHNHSLSFILQSCKISGLQDQKISLSFKYRFHKDRLDSPEMKKVVEDVLREVFCHDLKVETEVNENLELNNKKDKSQNQIIDNLLKTFGGQVIN